MKKVLPICMMVSFLLSSLPSFSQVLFNEDFENGWTEGFTMINVDGLTPDDPDLVGLADSAWSVRYITQAGWNSNVGFSVSWYLNDEGPSNDWMILPAVNLGNNTVLSWVGMAITSSGNYRDRYQVAISTGGPVIEDFEQNALLFDTGEMGEEITPQSRMINLADAGYANQTVYLAFRNFTAPYNPDLPSGPGNGGNELMIDDIGVEVLSSTSESLLQAIDLQVSPNPAQDHIRVSYVQTESGSATVTVRDLFGRTYLQQDFGNR
ncbi:MAG: choice-of-anchor J domain-containing protein [Saprospirales bacterium]|nr:choice-of-anchor J domain-containing protein [Saprospirales bacterium]